MGLPLLLAAPALAAARGGLAVVVPLTAAPRDLARLRATLGRWNTPDFAPCRLDDRATPAAAHVRRDCGFAPEKRAHEPPALIFYANRRWHEHVRRDVGAWLGAAAACFQRVEFRAANLTAAEDGYPYGASHVFYAVHADMFADRRVRHFFYTEPDSAPIRARWADALQALVQTERFWVKGSAVRGPAKVDEWVIRHVNGNALYDAHDAEFRAVVREASRAAPRMHARLDPYDLALAAYFHDPWCPTGRHCAPTTSVAWRRERLHLYRFAEFAANHHDAVLGVAAARRAYPCALFVHGNRTAVNADRARGVSPNAVIKARELARKRARVARRAARRGRGVVAGAVASLLAVVAARRLRAESRPGRRLCLCKARGWLMCAPFYALERNHRPGRAGGPGGASRWAPTAAGAARSCEAACGGRSRRTSFRGRRRAHFPRRKATLEDDSGLVRQNPRGPACRVPGPFAVRGRGRCRAVWPIAKVFFRTLG